MVKSLDEPPVFLPKRAVLKPGNLQVAFVVPVNPSNGPAFFWRKILSPTIVGNEKVQKIRTLDSDYRTYMQESFPAFGGDERVLDHLTQVKFQSGRDPQQGFQTWRPEVSFDKADHGMGESGFFGYLGHGKVSFFASFPQNTRNIGTDQV